MPFSSPFWPEGRRSSWSARSREVADPGRSPRPDGGGWGQAEIDDRCPGACLTAQGLQAMGARMAGQDIEIPRQLKPRNR